MNRLGIALLGLIAAAALTGCGGDIHFVRDTAPVPQTPDPVAPAERVVDKFISGRPTGTPVVSIVLNPLKSVSLAKDAISEFQQDLAAELLTADASSLGFEFQLIRDDLVSSAASIVPGRSLDPVSTTVSFFRAAMQSFNWEGPGQPVDPGLSGFGAMTKVARELENGPVDERPMKGFHFVYLRDTDTVTKRAGENAVALEQDPLRAPFLKAVNHKDFPTFRYRIHNIVYHPGSTCRPPVGRRSTRWRSSLDGLPVQDYDYCAIRDADSAAIREIARKIAASIRSVHKRLILTKAPKLDTLEIRVNGVSVQRNNVHFDPEQNELQFYETSGLLPQPGDTVEVSYEPQAS